MGLEERFEEPRLSTAEVEFEDEGIVGQLNSVVGPVKKNLRYIIAAVAVLVIAFFAYDFFVGSVATATITIVDTEGKAVDATVKLYAEGSDEPLFSESGDSTYSVQLRHGTYRAEARASGYAVKKTSIEIAPGDTDKEIELQKNLNVEILGFADAFPAQLFVSETRQVTVELKNKSSNTVQVELVPEGALEDWANETSATIPGNATETVTINVRVPTDTEVKDEKSGDSKTASLRVRYTREKTDAEFTLWPNPLPNITLSEISFTGLKAKVGSNKKAKDVTVRNKNKFPLLNLRLSVEITSSTENRQQDVIEWFQFSEVADQPQHWTIEISSIEPGKSVKKELQVVVPLTAKEERGIKGNVVLNADYLPEPKKSTLTLDVTEAAEHGIELTLSPRPPYEIEWDSDQGRYGEEVVTLEVKNTGQIDLEQIIFSIDNRGICSSDWLAFLENTINELKARDDATLRLRVTAPIFQRGQESTMHCGLHYRYDDPLQLGRYIEDTIADFLQITPEAED